MKRPRIAYCSPVNPAPSGISDYSEELLPYLAQYGDITLFFDDELKPTNSALTAHLEVLPIRRLERQQRRKPFDAIIYHIGNSPAHARIWRAAQRLPGVIVLHDYVLHHFMLWYAANVDHHVQQYVAMMTQRYGAEGAHIAQLMIRSRFTDAAFDYPCNEAVIDAAYGLIAHSQFVATQVQAQRSSLPVAVVPMGVPLPPLIEPAVARARLGLPDEGAILASFGHINAYKRLEPALRALAILRAEGRDVRYILVGSVSPNYDVQGLVNRMGLADAVTVTGYVDRDQFEAYVAAADLCLNLRYPTGGETSASLLRLLGAGRPTLVTATGSFAELPPGVAAQVDPDASEGDLILAYCRLLLDHPARAAELGTRARAFVAQEHTLEQAAQGYARFLARLYGWPLLQRVRERPLWDVEQPTPDPSVNAGQAGRTLDEPRAGGPTLRQTQGRAADGQAIAAPPEPAPDPTPLLVPVARAIAEIGLNESDERLLKTVAEQATAIGLNTQN
jgi:glycosyltransferase involved in cell wall biosynthesis